MGVFNYNTVASSVWVEFQEERQSLVLIITLTILGGLLAIGLIVAIVLIVRRFREDQNRVNDPENVQNQQHLFVRSQVLKLRASEVELLFPVVCRGEILPDNESISNLEKGSDKCEFKCSICLCEIGSDDPIRVGYCRHIFHANCLVTWF